jgi:hypothetical protein
MWLRKQGEHAACRGPLAREMNRVPMLISPGHRASRRQPNMLLAICTRIGTRRQLSKKIG